MVPNKAILKALLLIHIIILIYIFGGISSYIMSIEDIILLSLTKLVEGAGKGTAQAEV